MILNVPDVRTATTEDVKRFTAEMRARIPFSDSEVLFAAIDIFMREYEDHQHGDDEPNSEDYSLICGDLWAMAHCLNIHQGHLS